MSILKIEGGTPLHGTLRVSGNKNAILPMIAAAFLTDEGVTFTNVPRILDVLHMIEIARSLGAEVEHEGDKLFIKAGQVCNGSIPHEYCTKVRTSIMFVAPLLHRCGHVEIYPPGGDVIGRRRLDTHFYGLEKLGVNVDIGHKTYKFDLKDGFKASDLFFDEASVTATEHIMMAAAVSEGTTYIRNAASEPHVQDLAKLLNKMGADIQGIGTNQLTINGVSSLKAAEHRVCSDHIEAASFLAIAAATGGSITLEGTEKPHYWMAHRVFETLGVNIQLNHDNIFLSDNQSLKIKTDMGGSIPCIDDGPWPQFPSDMMSCMIVLATQSVGTTLFFEKMFESRLYFVDKLIAMGANAVVCDPHRVVIVGKSQLRAATVTSPDIRAGMALLGAALCAKGQSEVQNIQMVDRGYENIENKLLTLGAKVKRID
ncbi:MAG: UDP-N-acetylglucosamine 1-carboxyvinyltransferase [Lentisphaeraceae bacterium]|nr:UDP-N-acetylglucosamine 1-carboxyvinyltransferase [Lentisphaeraceae bacterium]